MMMLITPMTAMLATKPRGRARTMVHPDPRVKPTPIVMMARVAAVVVGVVAVIAVANALRLVPTSRGRAILSRFRVFLIFATKATDSFE